MPASLMPASVLHASNMLAALLYVPHVSIIDASISAACQQHAGSITATCQQHDESSLMPALLPYVAVPNLHEVVQLLLMGWIHGRGRGDLRGSQWQALQ
jgi:hypothetical protein